MTGRTAISATALALAVIVGLSAARTEAMPIPHVEEWLVISSLQGKTDETTTGKDSFLLKGYFHCEPDSFDPAAGDVTVAIDDWNVTIPADQWKKQGQSKFKAKYSGVTAQIDYWVKGSGRCNFTFVGTKQTLGANVPNYPDVPVRIAVTPSVDFTVTAHMEDFAAVSKMTELKPLSFFAIDKIEVKRNPDTAHKDAYKIWGRVFLVGNYDPSVNGIYVSMGEDGTAIMPGEIAIPASGNKIKFNKTFPDGRKLLLQVNTDTGQMYLFVKDVDLAAFTNPPWVIFYISNMVDSLWGYAPYLQQANKTGTLHKF